MPTNESQLKKIITEAIQEAGKLLFMARKEQVSADDVAVAYMTALNNINEYCKTRNRY